MIFLSSICIKFSHHPHPHPSQKLKFLQKYRFIIKKSINMEMIKIVRGIAPIVLIIYLAIRDFFFFSSKLSSSINIPHDHQHPQSSSSSSTIYQVLIHAKPGYLFIFFIFNILLVAVLVRISSQLSKSSSSPKSNKIELSISSFIDSYEDLKGDDDEKDGDKKEYKDDFIPSGLIVYAEDDGREETVDDQVVESFVDDEEGKDGTKFQFEYDDYGVPYYDYGYVHVHHVHDDEFVPGIVHVEYKEEKVVEKKDEDHQEEMSKDEILICEEFDDFEEEEEDSYSDLDDVDFNKRIEEFIGENNKKWREELQNDWLLESY